MTIMLHLLYVLAFTILAVLAVGNLLRSLFTVGIDTQRSRGWSKPSPQFPGIPHPELLDESGNYVNEPLLVMRSMNVQDAREQLDALYKSSPGFSDDPSEEG
jgi:hypothetical protein